MLKKEHVQQVRDRMLDHDIGEAIELSRKYAAEDLYRQEVVRKALNKFKKGEITVGEFRNLLLEQEEELFKLLMEAAT